MSATVHVLFEADEWLRDITAFNTKVACLMIALGPVRDDYQSLSDLAQEPRWFGLRRYLQPRWKRVIAAHLREHLVRGPTSGAQAAIEQAYTLLPRAWR